MIKAQGCQAANDSLSMYMFYVAIKIWFAFRVCAFGVQQNAQRAPGCRAGGSSLRFPEATKPGVPGQAPGHARPGIVWQATSSLLCLKLRC